MCNRTDAYRKNKFIFRHEVFLRTLMWKTTTVPKYSGLKVKVSLCDVTGNTVTIQYLRSGLGGVVKTSAEFDDVRKLRFVTLEMGTWDREPLGCSSNLTRILEGMSNHYKRPHYFRKSHKQFNKWKKSRVCYTISDFLKIPGLHKVWLYALKPPEKLRNEDHHIILQDTVIRNKFKRIIWQCNWSLFLKYFQCVMYFWTCLQYRWRIQHVLGLQVKAFVQVLIRKLLQ